MSSLSFLKKVLCTCEGTSTCSYKCIWELSEAELPIIWLGLCKWVWFSHVHIVEDKTDVKMLLMCLSVLKDVFWKHCSGPRKDIQEFSWVGWGQARGWVYVGIFACCCSKGSKTNTTFICRRAIMYCCQYPLLIALLEYYDFRKWCLVFRKQSIQCAGFHNSFWYIVFFLLFQISKALDFFYHLYPSAIWYMPILVMESIQRGQRWYG